MLRDLFAHHKTPQTPPRKALNDGERHSTTVEQLPMPQGSVFTRGSVEREHTTYDRNQLLAEVKPGQVLSTQDSSKDLTWNVQTAGGLTISNDRQEHTITVSQEQPGNAPKILSVTHGMDITHMPDKGNNNLEMGTPSVAPFSGGESLSEKISASGSVHVSHTRVTPSLYDGTETKRETLSLNQRNLAGETVVNHSSLSPVGPDLHYVKDRHATQGEIRTDGTVALNQGNSVEALTGSVPVQDSTWLIR